MTRLKALALALLATLAAAIVERPRQGPSPNAHLKPQVSAVHPAAHAASPQPGPSRAQGLALAQQAIKPPKDIKTVSHMKEKGNGYLEGSPLYKRQQKLEAKESSKLEESEPTLSKGKDNEDKIAQTPGFWLPTLSLLCGFASVAAVYFWNRKTGTVDSQAARSQKFNLSAVPMRT